MVESVASVSDNARANHVPQPTHAVAAEDDDEPPSSGPLQSREAQMTHSDPSEANRFPPIKSRDTLEIQEREKSSDEPDIAGFERIDTTTTLDVEKQEDPAERRRSHRTGPAPTALDRFRALFTPQRDIGPRPTYVQSLKAILRYSPLNLLLVFIPVSWALHYSHQSPTLIFIFSCLGIIPLAALLGLGTEQIALRTSQSIGGLMNATFGNAIEMIIAAIALSKCELELIQSSLLGGLLSNLLLVLGMAFMVGGYRFSQQEFQPMVARLNSSLLIVSVISLIIPVAFHYYLEARLPAGKELMTILQLSRGSSVILILIYVAYLFFQFYSHNHLFLDTHQVADSSSYSGSSSSSSKSRLSRQSTLSETLPVDGRSIASTATTASEEPEMLKLNLPAAFMLLAAITGLAYVTAENLVDSLEGLIADHPSISKQWITLIVIPIIGNAAEHATVVVVATKGKFDLALTVAIGSCIQIALFVIPVLVLVAWGLDKPLSLLFDPLETIVLFFSVLVVKFSVEDGKSHWLSGLVLVSVYALIALTFWNFPDSPRIIGGVPLSCH